MDITTYLLKSTALLSLFFLVDYLFLRKETLYKHNRYFLLLGIVCSLAFPFLEFTQTTYVEAAPAPLNFAEIPVQMVDDLPVEETFDWQKLLLSLYICGVAFMLIRFVLQLTGLFKLLQRPKHKDAEGFYHIELLEKLSPFSFFNYIAYHLKSYSQEELALIIEHEKIHGKQYHSVDVLLNQLMLILFWFNPLMWFYQRRILENLEFMVDHEMAKEETTEQKDYELTLLKVSTNYQAPSLANQFYQSLIKKRIVMLNKKQSNRFAVLKTAIVLPLLGVFLWSFNVKEEVKIREEKPSENIQQQKSVDSTKSQSMISEVKISYDENTTIEQLKEDQKFLKEEFDVEMNFSEVNFNAKNELTSLKIEIIQEKSTSSAFSDNGNQPIDRLFIHSGANFKDGQKSFFTGKVTTNNTPEVRKKSTTETLSKVLNENEKIILNGKKTAISSLKNKKILLENFHINTLEKPALLVAKGIIIDSYKPYLKQGETQNFISINDDGQASAIQFSTIDENFQKNNIIEKDPTKINASGSPNENEKLANSIRSLAQEKPLYYINEKKATEEDLKSLNPEKIESINVLKNENAIEKYGEEGKNGVIEVTLKETQTETEEDLWSISRGKNYSEGDYIFVVGNSIIEKEELDKIEASAIKNIRIYTAEDAKKILHIDAKGKKVIEFELFDENEKARLSPEDILKQKKYQDLINDNKVMIVLDGKEISRKELRRLNQTQIKTVFSADGDTAVKRFGKKAKHGVLVINTK